MAVVNVTAGAETFTCNAYLVTEDPTTLVDAGSMPGVAAVIERHVDGLDAVVLTHQHGDHVEELGSVVDRFDPDVYAFDPHPARTHSIEDGDEVNVGPDRYEVVHTPGHASDHVSLLGESTIFSGDVVVYNDAAFDDGSFGRTDRPGQSREDLIASLRRILDRLPAEVEHLYAGHGDPFHGDVRAVIERALERAERREPKYPE